MRAHLPQDLQVVVTIAHTYGWRILSEVMSLKLAQVDLEAGTIRLEPGQTKNQDGRIVYLTPELQGMPQVQVDRVKAFMRERGALIPHLFPHLTGRFKGTPRRDFVKAWKGACLAAMLDGKDALARERLMAAVQNNPKLGLLGIWWAHFRAHQPFSACPRSSKCANMLARPGSSIGRVPAF